MQEDTALPSPDDGSATPHQVIDEGEYVTLLEQIQGVRQHVRGLTRPTELDPWRFFAPFDRVKLKPGYIPDFVFTPFERVAFGPGVSTEMENGPFTLTTRRVPQSAQESEGAHVIVKPPVELSLYRKAAFSHLLERQGVEGLVCERSASGFLQLAVFCLEADRWHRNRLTDFPLDPDWRWVCSAQQREALILAPPVPPYWARSPGISQEQSTWLRNADAHLRVRIQEDTAEVGGLAYSPWDGFAWLDCELTWPNRFRITRLEVLYLYKKMRPMF